MTINELDSFRGVSICSIGYVSPLYILLYHDRSASMHKLPQSVSWLCQIHKARVSISRHCENVSFICNLLSFQDCLPVCLPLVFLCSTQFPSGLV